MAFVWCVCAHECVRRHSSVSHRVGIKAWDDPFFNEQTLRFDRSLTRHYRSLGASALLIQHPQDPHAHSQALTFTQTPRFSSQQIHGLDLEQSGSPTMEFDRRSVGILILVRLNKLQISLAFILNIPFPVVS